MELSLSRAAVFLPELLTVSNALLFLAVFLLTADYINRRPPKNYPPGPFSWPLVGNLLQLHFKQPHLGLCQLAEKYGDIFSMQLGSMRAVMINGLQMVKEALVHQGDNFEGRYIPIVYEIFKGFGIINSNGHIWKQQRRFALLTLRNFGMGKRSLEERIIKEIRYLTEAMEDERGQPFDPHFLISKSVSNVISAISFGDRFDYQDVQFQELLHLLDETLKLQVTVPSQFKGEAASSFNEDNLVHSTMDLFVAGTDTTSTTLRWALLYMAAYTDIQAKVQAEIDRVIGNARQPLTENRKDMPYTNAVLHEVQRIGNIVPFAVPRLTTCDTVLRGFNVPKGTTILVNLTTVLFDKDEWETPNTFNPEHFLENGKFKQPEAFLPFSIGKRVCLGEQLAKMELFLYFTTLLQRFTFTAPKDVKLNVSGFRVSSITSPLPYTICAIARS